jgi:hypothetical protein
VLNVLPQHLCVVVCKSRQRLDAFLLQRLADIDAAGREQSGKHSNAQAHRSAVARKLQAGSFVNSWERAPDASRALCGGAFTWGSKTSNAPPKMAQCWSLRVYHDAARASRICRAVHQACSLPLCMHHGSGCWELLAKPHSSRSQVVSHATAMCSCSPSAKARA